MPYKISLLRNKLNIVYILGLLLVIISIVAYRYSIISNYVAHVADEDQVIMWYGTLAALDNNIHEPHFLGQKYGSMLESYVAIPFYLLSFPLEYALPMGTVLLWFLPFGLCAYALVKKEQWLEAVIILGMSLLFGWQYDVLTNISRSFIGGFWLIFLGLIIVLKEEKTPEEIFASIVFFTLGFWVSEQTITVLALIVFHILYEAGLFTAPRDFYRKFMAWEKDKKIALFLGLALAVLFLGYCNYLFYNINPDYDHHKIGSLKLKSRILKDNLRHIGELFEAYSLVTIKEIPVCAIGVIGAFLAYWKKYSIKECFILFGLSVLGIIIIMSSKKSVDFTDPLLLGRKRIYLFIPYIGLLLAYLTFKLKNLSKMVMKAYGTKALQLAFVVLVACFVGIAGIKSYNFQNDYRFNEGLHTSDILRVHNVKLIKEVAQEVGELARKNHIKNIVFFENCTYAYGTATYNYGEFRIYLSHYERKTEDYLFYKNHPFTGKILFVNCDEKGILNYKIEEFHECNIIDYLAERYLRERHRYITDELYQKDCM